MKKNELKSELKRELKKARIDMKVTIVEISEAIKVSSPAISVLENNLFENTRVKYLVYLRGKGLDLNKLFDKYKDLSKE